MKTLTISILHLITVGLLTLTASSMAQAAPLTVPNSSFETPASTSDQISTPNTNTVIQDWTLAGAANYSGLIYYAGSSSYDTITGGTGSQGAVSFPIFGYYTATLTSGNAVNNDGSFSGITGYDSIVRANTHYTLTADIGIPSGESVNETADYQGYIELRLVDSVGNIFASQRYDSNTLSVGHFTNESLNYTSLSSPSDLGEGLKIQFFIQNGSNDDHSAIAFDNIQLSGPDIPEPSTYAMLIGGLAVLGICAQRKASLIS